MEMRFRTLAVDRYIRLFLITAVVVVFSVALTACSNASDNASKESGCESGIGCDSTTQPASNHSEDEQADEHDCDDPTSCASAYDPDLNDDGCVSGQDVKIVAVCLGNQGANNPNCQLELADVNADNHVDNQDLRLVVANNGMCGFPVDVNNAPIADAGQNQSAEIGETVTLDASGSSDPDGDTLSYNWSLETPPGSNAFILDSTAVAPSFLVDIAGTYTIQLIVNDGALDSFPDIISISTINSPPKADAGPDQTAPLLDTVQLDGSGSYDMDGDPLVYSWLLSPPSGSNAELSSLQTLKPAFQVDVPGTYIALLIVNDGFTDSVPDNVIIDTENSRPVANAGADQTSAIGDTVLLDAGKSSDIDGDSLTYSWSISSKPAASNTALSDEFIANPSFQVDVAGNYVFELRVNDGFISSASDSVTVSTLNSKPVANAGDDQPAFNGDTITLDGSASSDADADPLTYAWSLIHTPPASAASLSDASTIMPSFVIDAAGDYVAQLIVNDGVTASDADTVLVSTNNLTPVANAGPDQNRFIGDSVMLDGTASRDANGDSLIYSWALTSKPAGSAAELLLEDTATPQFVVDRAGRYSIQLIVSDGLVASTPDTILVTVDDNQSPTAVLDLRAADGRIISDGRVPFGSEFSLDGSRSVDIGGSVVKYVWTFMTNATTFETATPGIDSTVLLQGQALAPGQYLFQLIAEDNSGNQSTPAQLTVIITDDQVPIAVLDLRAADGRIISDGRVPFGSEFSLDGSRSVDIGGSVVKYVWTFMTNATTFETATPGIDSTVLLQGQALAPGQYLFQLIAEDNSGNQSTPAQLTVIITDDQVPIAVLDLRAADGRIIPDGRVPFGSEFSLDGSRSVDIGGSVVKYVWTFMTNATTFETATPSIDSTVLLQGQALAPGQYLFQLIAEDNSGNQSTPAQLTVIIF